MRRFIPPALVALVLAVAGCASSPKPALPTGAAAPASRTPAGTPQSATGEPGAATNPVHGTAERGLASWYGHRFHGRRTASGERFDMHAFTAAHGTLPLGSFARVTLTGNGKSVVVRITDRGPHAARRIIDVSRAAAVQLGLLQRGTGEVLVERVPAPE